MANRLSKLRDKLGEGNLDALIVSQSENRRYLSGFAGSAGFLIVSQERAVLATDFRYFEQARDQASDFEVIKIEGDPAKWFPGLFLGINVISLGFEARDFSYATYRQFAKVASEIGKEVTLVPTDGLVESLRVVKEAGEMECLEKAAATADAALEEVHPQIQAGVSEKEIAWALESSLRQHGSEPLPFDVIVASGPNAALPHAGPSDRIIQDNEPVVVDFGARIGGYVSDITRTFCLGGGDNEFHRIYDIVLGAQLTALEILEAGMSGDQVDLLARMVIMKAGYGDAFGHGLGHGVGLAAHEEPRLGPGSADILVQDTAFTIEPGVYIPGWGGVRIEDTVVLKEGRTQPLTKSKK
ncbi:M24 family metallopeptidase [Chloroflexota bacterium]